MASFGHYKVVGDNVLSHYQETMLMTRTTTSMVKATIARRNTMEDIDDFDINLQPFDIAHLIVFINLYSSSFGGDAPS